MIAIRLITTISLLILIRLFSYGQVCDLDTAKYNTIVNNLFYIDYNCDYSLNVVQYSEILKREKLSKYVQKRYKFKSLNIDSSQYTIVLFKLKKCKRHIAVEKSGYLGTPNPLYGTFFTKDGYLILIYTYFPYNPKHQNDELNT